MRVSTYVHDWDWLCTWVSEILDHVLDEHGALSDFACYDEVSIRRRSTLDKYHLRTELSTLSELRSLTVWSSSAIVMMFC